MISDLVHTETEFFLNKLVIFVVSGNICKLCAVSRNSFVHTEMLKTSQNAAAWTEEEPRGLWSACGTMDWLFTLTRVCRFIG